MKEPRRKLTTDDEPLDQQIADAEDTVDTDKIRSILDSNDVSGGKVRIERKGPNDQHFQYCCIVPIEQFDVEHLKRTFGGGDYKAKTFRANGQMYKPFEFSIDYRFKGSMDVPGTSEKSNSGNDVANFANSLLIKQDAAGQNALLKVMELTSRQQESSMTVIMKMMVDSQERQLVMMKELFSAIKPPAQAAPQVDFATAFTPILLEMVKSRATTNGPVAEAIAAMKQLKELNDKPNEDKEEDTMLDKIMKVLPVAAGMFAPRPQAQLAQAQAAQTLPLPPEALFVKNLIATKGGITLPDHVAMGIWEKVNLLLSMMAKSAAREADPAVYYEMMLDSVAPQHIGVLKAALTDPGWRANLLNNDARVVQYEAWFEELRYMILHDGQVPPEEETQSPPPEE